MAQDGARHPACGKEPTRQPAPPPWRLPPPERPSKSKNRTRARTVTVMLPDSTCRWGDTSGRRGQVGLSDGAAQVSSYEPLRRPADQGTGVLHSSALPVGHTMLVAAPGRLGMASLGVGAAGWKYRCRQAGGRPQREIRALPALNPDAQQLAFVAMSGGMPPASSAFASSASSDCIVLKPASPKGRELRKTLFLLCMCGQAKLPRRPASGHARWLAQCTAMASTASGCARPGETFCDTPDATLLGTSAFPLPSCVRTSRLGRVKVGIV